ncbi:RHS repeat-associated core domain-containing protein [Cronobacter turicensis]
MHSGAHFDPQLGLDIHLYPWPLPTPHIGLVFDVFDYLPFIGTTVHVNGIRRASAGTGGIAIHIPTGGAWVPPLRMPGGPQLDDELFMGSKTVAVDGEPFSRIGMPVLSCNIVGMMPPFRPKRAAKPKLPSLTLPLTFNLALPNNVIVGGPPTVNLMALLMRAGLSGLGKGLKKLKATPQWRLFMRRFATFRQKLFRNMDPGFLKCRVLRAEPVDIRDGSVHLEHRDFLLPGRLPLDWGRFYSSADIDQEGLCGFGWLTPADTTLEVLRDEGVALLTQPEGVTLFAGLPASPGREHAVFGLPDGSRLWYEEQGGERCWQVSQESALIWRFAGGRDGLLNVTAIADRHHNRWQFERDGGQLTRLCEHSADGATGREILVTCHHGRLQTMQLRIAQGGEVTPLTRYEYDDTGQLCAEIDALSHPRRFHYRQRRMVSHVDRNGQGFHYAYDDAWRVVHAWGDGGVWDYHFEYHTLLNEVAVTDSLGHVSRITFDENGLPVSEIDPLGGNTVFRYDDVGRTVEVTEPDGRQHRWEYDEQGRMTAEHLPGGGVVRATFNDDGQPLCVTDESGAQWVSSYDAAGNLTEGCDPTGVCAHYIYDTLGQLREADVPGRGLTRYDYDHYGFLAVIQEAGAGETRLHHSPRGTLLDKRDASGDITRYFWDMKDRLAAMQTSVGQEIRIEYNREDEPVRYTDEAGRETRFDYNATGMVTACHTADGAQTGYEYDPEDRLHAVINQNGERWTLSRDALGRVVTETDYWGQATRYQWDRGDQLVSRLDPLGREVRYGYDRAGRVRERRSGDTLTARYHYDDGGRLTLCENPWRRLAWRYDRAGRVLCEDQDGFQLRYGYTARGLPDYRESDAGHRVGYAWNENDRLIRVQLNDDAPIELRYDETGRLANEQLSPSILRAMQYDAQGRLTAQEVTQGDLPLFASGFAYDRAGNMTLRQDSQWGDDRYRYDPVGRLVAHSEPDGALRQFVHDAAGNHLPTRIQAVDDSPGGWFREGVHEGVRYVFDRAGELRQRRHLQTGEAKEDFLWDENRQLIAVRKGERQVRYGYDALGRRVFKETPEETRWFYWQGDALAGETVTRTAAPLAPLSLFDTGGRIKREQAQATLFHQMREYVYYPGTFRPLALLTQEAGVRESWHYHCDPNGAPVRITSIEGEIVWSERAGAWGEKGPVYASRIDNPLRFQGQYFDPETGLHYNRYRYYDPAIAAYISQDPIGMLGGGNPYRYAPNALMWIDPLGLIRGPVSLPDEPGIYIIHAGGKSYVGSAGIKQQGMLSRVSSPEHAHAQRLLSQPDVKIQYVRVRLSDSLTESERNNILRYFEQREFDKEVKRVGITNMLNDPHSRIQAEGKRSYALSLISKNKVRASSRRTTCKKS